MKQFFTRHKENQMNVYQKMDFKITNLFKKMNNFKSKKIKLLKNLNNNVLTEYRVKENLFSTKEDFKAFKNFKMNNIQKK